MAMKALLLTAGMMLTLVPPTALAVPPKHKTTTKMVVTMYECSKCHMKYTAAEAKKDHYKDPMDGGKLMPVKPAASVKPMSGMKM